MLRDKQRSTLAAAATAGAERSGGAGLGWRGTWGLLGLGCMRVRRVRLGGLSGRARELGWVLGVGVECLFYVQDVDANSS